MEFYQKMPRNKKEFVLFMGVLSVLSVNIIAPVITCFELGFKLSVWAHVLRVLPFIWVSVVAIVLITYIPAEKLTHSIVKEGDSFGAVITVNILCSVLLMSVFLTIVGSWIGSGHISMEPIYNFFYKWPRNFAVSLGVEAVIAQPIARLVMTKFHSMEDSWREFEASLGNMEKKVEEKLYCADKAH